MVSNFSAALLRHFSAPLIWRLFQDVVSSEEMAVLQQADRELVVPFLGPKVELNSVSSRI